MLFRLGQPQALLEVARAEKQVNTHHSTVRSKKIERTRPKPSFSAQKGTAEKILKAWKALYTHGLDENQGRGENFAMSDKSFEIILNFHIRK